MTEMTLTRKTLFLATLAVLFIGAGVLGLWHSRPTQVAPTSISPTGTPEALFPTRPKATHEMAAMIRETLKPTWQYATYQEYDTFDGRHISEWSTFLVSSGEFDTVEVGLDGDQPVQVDVVFAYQTTQTGATLTLPVAIGFLTGDVYTYFSPDYAYSGEGHSFTSLSQTEALADAKTRLPEGQLFRLTLAEYVTREKLAWPQCPAFAIRTNIPAPYCTLGEQLDAQFPQQARYLPMRLLENVSSAWFVFGFWFYEQEAPDA